MLIKYILKLLIVNYQFFIQFMQQNNLSPLTIYQNIATSLEKCITGQTSAIRKLLAAFACGGHVLLEDLPGM